MDGNNFDDTIYIPSDDEEFMNERQVTFFRTKLIEWKESILEGTRSTIEDMQGTTRSIPDAADRASEETDRALELRTRDRQRKLIGKIESALRKIEDGSYGFCEDTGSAVSSKAGLVPSGCAGSYLVYAFERKSSARQSTLCACVLQALLTPRRVYSAGFYMDRLRRPRGPLFYLI